MKTINFFDKNLTRRTPISVPDDSINVFEQPPSGITELRQANKKIDELLKENKRIFAELEESNRKAALYCKIGVASTVICSVLSFLAGVYVG